MAARSLRWYVTSAVASALVAVLTPNVAGAHHSFAAVFEMEKMIELEGRVTEIRWSNPHIKFLLDPTDGGEIWEIEAGPTNLLSRMGIERDLIQVGDTIRVRGNPARRDARALWVMNILLPDKTELLANPTAEPFWASSTVGDSSDFFEPGELTRQVRDDRSIFRVWFALIPNMPMPQGPPVLTAHGRQAQAAYDRGDVAIDDCERPGMPFAMVSPYPIRFIDRGNRIVLRMEAYDQERIIHMRALPDPPAPSPLGYSVGRREGDSLIVETSSIDYHSFGDLGPAQSEHSKVIEQFTLSPDGSELFYEATVIDPVNLAEPWRWRGSFIYREGEELLRWNCGAEQ